MTNKYFVRAQRGFTLIELLVVVAIIGILATLILISLGTVRGRARDARINSDVAQTATQCEVQADTDSDYRNCLVTAAAIVPLVRDMDLQNGTGAAPTITLANANTRFCVETDLFTAVGGAHQQACRDSEGNVTPPGGGANVNVGCDANAVCDGTP